MSLYLLTSGSHTWTPLVVPNGDPPIGEGWVSLPAVLLSTVCVDKDIGLGVRLKSPPGQIRKKAKSFLSGRRSGFGGRRD
jgi:hypothetical protein